MLFVELLEGVFRGFASGGSHLLGTLRIGMSHQGDPGYAHYHTYPKDDPLHDQKKMTSAPDTGVSTVGVWM